MSDLPDARSRAKRTASRPGSRPKGNAIADKLARIGISRDEDLVLYLPLRYEDHTRIVALHDVHLSETSQTEGVIAKAGIRYRPRRRIRSFVTGRRHGRLAAVRRLRGRTFMTFPI